MKTIREIANELGVDKQKVYRFIKQNHINEAHHEALQRSGVKYYDEAAETLIKQGFSDETASSEAHHEAHQNRINEAVFDAVIEMLQKELEIKNEQIKELILEDGYPNGYVVVKFSDNDPVVSEFSLGENIRNPYAKIMERANIETDAAIFYSVGSNDYQVLDTSRNVIALDNSTELVSEKEFAVYKSAEKAMKQAAVQTRSGADDGLNYSDLDGWSVVSDSYEGSVKDGKEHTITGAGNVSLWYCQDHVENNNRTYACSVVALCNLAKYYRERGYDKISRSFTTLYDTMWEKAGTNSSGTTSNGNEAPAAKAFMEDLGYSCSYDSYLFDSYSDFTRDLGNNKPCIFTYGAKFGSKSGGHAVLAVGYVETTKYQYLRIADGWNDYLRYINFNGYDYTRKDGWSFSVSK